MLDKRRRQERCMQNYDWWGGLGPGAWVERGHLEDLCVDGRIILK